jgi:predicted membrane-bound mannosyltransferase
MIKNLIISKKYELFLFFVIIVSAIFLRYYNYNYQDFWWDELMELSTSDPTISLKETYIRAHNLTIGTSLDYDYATNANLYFYIYKFIFSIFSYTPGIGRLITATFGVLVFLLSTLIYKKFIGNNYIFFSALISFNYYLVIQSQEFKYNIFFCLILNNKIYY